MLLGDPSDTRVLGSGVGQIVAEVLDHYERCRAQRF